MNLRSLAKRVLHDRFIKLNAAGRPLSMRATRWVANYDLSTDLIWSRERVPGSRRNWAASVKAASQVDLCGWTDWRAPTRVELLSLVDDTRHGPAIDTRFFPECTGDWEWTSTPAAFSPGDCAWVVFFDSGDSDWGGQGGGGCVRAVRPGQSLDIGSRKTNRKVRA